MKQLIFKREKHLSVYNHVKVKCYTWGKMQGSCPPYTYVEVILQRRHSSARNERNRSRKNQKQAQKKSDNTPQRDSRLAKTKLTV